MTYLKEIILNIPDLDKDFLQSLLKFLKINEKVDQTSDSFFPSISILEVSKKDLTVSFCLNNECLTLIVNNITNKEWPNSYRYSPISLEDLCSRINSENILNIDHLGVNLPWDKESIHPALLEIRDRLKNNSLYHEFPSGEPWDFIIPGSISEILKESTIDYNLDRKPKFEIVSFTGCSKPLVQIDVSTNLVYKDMKTLFPEAIALDGIKALWIYLKTNYDFDFCLVLNERSGGWTNFFKDSRLA